VHEMVAKTFPMLTHTRMLQVTHELEQRRFDPGTTIVHEGETVKGLHIITQGSAQVAVQDVPVTHLSSGEYFGEIELLQNRPAVATIRNASDNPLETVSLDRRLFSQLLTETIELKETIFRVVRERLAENHSARSRIRATRRTHAQTTLA